MADAPPSSTAALENSQKLENAIRAVNEKRPPPEIDFTLHTMEDGTQVSTLERVCKGQSVTVPFGMLGEACLPIRAYLGTSSSLRG